MGLPKGFDPATGTFTGVTGPKIQTNYNYGFSPSSFSDGYPTGGQSRTRGRNLWDWFNDAIRSVGNWIEDIIEPISGWIALIAIVIGAIGLLFWVFSDSNIIYIILRVIGACIAGYILMIGLGIFLFCMSFVMKAIRFIFWNGWTLLLALALAAGGWAYTTYGPPSSKTADTEVTTGAYEKYHCTADVLNIRTQPNTTSQVLGTLRKGDEVEVIGKENGFAIINYRTHRAYVSLRYLSKD